MLHSWCWCLDRLLLDPAFMWRHPHLLRDFDYIGMHYYSITWCCDDRELLFTQPDRVDLVRGQNFCAPAGTQSSKLLSTASCPITFISWCTVVLRRQMARNSFALRSSTSGFYFKQAFDQRLWQRYGMDRFVRNDGDIRAIAQYIIENPVRAGLVTRPEDHPFTGSHVYTLEQLIEWAYS
jgi:hypothetical protein